MEIRWEAQCRVAGSITAGITPQTFGNVTSPIKNRSAGLLGGGRSAWCSCPYPQLQCDHPFPSSVKVWPVFLIPVINRLIGVLGDFKKEPDGNSSLRFYTGDAMTVATDLPSPFGQLGVFLSDAELRQTAYEILVAACRANGGKPLTYIPQSDRTVDRSLPPSLTSAATSKMKKAFGIRSPTKKGSLGPESISVKSSTKKPASVGELMRVQMGISEQLDARIRRGLLRIAAGNKKREKKKREKKKREKKREKHVPRTLPFLVSPVRSIACWQFFSPQGEERGDILRSAVTSLAYRLLDGIGSDACHWADGFPLNLHLNIELMETIVSFGVTAAKILVEDFSTEYHPVKFNVILKPVLVLMQKMKQTASSKRSSEDLSAPLLSILAEEIEDLASKEKELFSPILKKWHPLAAGVAVTTLHSCYGNELKQFLSSVKELTPDVLQVLGAADKLEKDLLDIVVEDSVDSDDGGKSLIREMPPYEAESAIADLVRVWIKSRLDQLEEWLDRTLQQEV
ncbi:hypothetical protein B296_00044314 [Ensete ventricosum]|uniref:MHD1 domain-containing protein n=1 Tax=Ensete ventricosum TaxID=4639 RepID=A0A426X5B3_ENSVE|nr:hypothetical protein B296_00044314 [Ensete ventricosum]